MALMSEWHRWDLHIHTPETLVNDNFTDENGHKGNKDLVWENYITKLNDYGAEVLGITDYFSAQNFFKLKRNRRKWGLNSDIVIFPNIEMRANDLVSKKRQDNGKATSYVNIHFIFRPDVSEKKITKFLREVRFTKDGGETINVFENIDEIKVGSNFVFLPTTSQILKGLKSAFGEKFTDEVMIMIPNSGDGITLSEGNGSQNGKEFLKKVNLIQARTENARGDQEYLLQTDNKYTEAFPAVSGCDAHDYSKMENFPSSSYTWIKCDKTFEGLKQITYEPRTRIAIQETKPQALLPSKIIKEVNLNGNFFTNKHLEFSEGLNTIIGGRSSGKSVLLSIMTKLSSGKNIFKRDNDDYNKLIEDLSSDSILKFAGGKTADGNDQIEFIYQDGLQEIARDKKKRNVFIEDTLNGIVSEEIELAQKGMSSFLQKKQNLFRQNIDKLTTLESNIASLSERISGFQNSVAIKKNLQSLKRRLFSLESSNELVPHDVINPILHEIQEIHATISKLKSDKKELNEFKNMTLLQVNPVLKQFHSEISTNIITELITRSNIIEAEIQNLIDTDIKQIHVDLTTMQTKESELQNLDIYLKYQLSEKISPEIQEIREAIQKQELDLSNYRKTRQLLDKAIFEQRQVYRQLQIDSFFKSILQEFTIYENDSLDIKYRTIVNFDKFIQLCQNTFKTTTNNFRQNIFDFSMGIKNEEDIIKIIHNIAKMASVNQLPFRNGQNIYTWCETFSHMSFLESNYHIYYKRTNTINNSIKLEKFTTMSEGKQAFILLLMKLSLAPKDTPFFIDQPEDELDNKAIYEDLVTHLRRQKLSRQIFVVTHNANIVVGGDSECVTIAEENIDLSSPLGHTFSYKQGPIEDLSIQNAICETLEGGQRAFKIRESRYTFQ